MQSRKEPGPLVAVEEGMQLDYEEAVRCTLLSQRRKSLFTEDSSLGLRDARLQGAVISYSGNSPEQSDNSLVKLDDIRLGQIIDGVH